jgi:hypothetical protein
MKGNRWSAPREQLDCISYGNYGFFITQVQINKTATLDVQIAKYSLQFLLVL